MEALLTAGANKDAPDKNGATPLHLAAKKGQKEIVEALLTVGADVNAKDNLNHTPLHFAHKRGHKEIAEALLTAGANAEIAKDLINDYNKENKKSIYSDFLKR